MVLNFIQQNKTILLAAGLMFIVGSSKNLLIYNEEILVALAFASFMWFIVTYYGKNFSESLDERSSSIQAELQKGLDLQEEWLTKTLATHQSTLLAVDLCKSLKGFVGQEGARFQETRQQHLTAAVYNQFHTQLKYLSQSNEDFLPVLQKNWGLALRASVQEKFQSSASSIQKDWVKQSLSILKNMKKSS
uniref:ATP synthase protein MI25 n=1 Tax=Chloropicon maureeniae TaxID=1461542 RepID=A0A4D6C534_9CHLO|nr:ATP synthase F0 subunit beta [Chloropicon maureeniae]QBX98795.1 ATP synthase F0 subunit beta [Chloropicon maureeniae]